MEFWNNKLFQNMKRDEQALSALANLGWQSLVVWTCEVKRKEQLQEKLAAFLPKE
jgi:DNA mismatch endonuclease (patch repair protein)